MFRFAYPVFLWGLLMLPVFVALFWSRMNWKKRAIARFGDEELVKRLMPDRSNARIRFKFSLMALSWTALVIGLADPQIGSRYEEVKRKGIDMVIALDVSNSMLAQDIRPSRLERAKQAIIRLIDKLGDDRLAVVIFAGEAHLQLPFTSDYAAARLFVSGVNTENISTQGTAVGAAIELGVQALPSGNQRSRAIIVISDGENHEDDAREAARMAREKGIYVHAIGIGSEAGAPIPVTFESGSKGYLTDENGTTVISRMNSAILSEVALDGGGKFVQASNSDVGLEALFDHINSMQKAELGSKAFTDYEDRFQYFLGFALLVMLIELLLPERRSAFSKRVNLFQKPKEQDV